MEPVQLSNVSTPSSYYDSNSSSSSSSSNIMISSNLTEITARCGHFWYITNDQKRPIHSADVALVKFIAYQIVLRLITMFGLIGNIINLIVLCRFKGRTYFYLFWLAVSDLCTMLLDNVTILRLNSAPQSYVDGFAFCHILTCCTGAFLTASTFIVVALTVERFIAVWRPIESRGILSNGQPFSIVLSCFIVGIAIFAPTSLTRRLDAVVLAGASSGNYTSDRIACHICSASDYQYSSGGRLYLRVREIVARVCPLVLVVVLNIAIVMALNRHQREQRSLNASTERVRDESGEDNLKTALITITVFFVVCMTPVVVKNLFRNIFYTNNAASEIFRATAVLLLQFNTACNFYVYCFCSKAIRQRLVELCRIVLPIVKRRHIDIISDKSPNHSGVSATTTVSLCSLNSIRAGL